MRGLKRISVLAAALLLLVFTLFPTTAADRIIPTQGPLLSGLLNVNANLLPRVLCALLSRSFSRASLALPPFVYQSADSCRKRENPLCSGSSSPPTLSLGACVPRDSLHFLHRYRQWPRNARVRSRKTEE